MKEFLAHTVRESLNLHGHCFHLCSPVANAMTQALTTRLVSKGNRKLRK